MEFNPIAAPKPAPKVAVAVVPADAGGSAAEAFAALMRVVGFQFSGDVGLSAVEGQLLRKREPRASEDQPRARTEPDRAKAKTRDPAAADDRDDETVPIKTKDDAAPTDAGGRAADSVSAGQSKSVSDAAATTESVAAVAMQFQIVIELPGGGTSQVAVVDLDTMLAAAAKDPALAKALQDAFTGVLGAIQSLGGPIAAQATGDLSTALAAAGMDSAALNGTDTDAGANLTSLFRQIIASLRPLAEQAKPVQPGLQNPQLASVDGGSAQQINPEGTLETRLPDTARQAADLTRNLGSEHMVKINVVVDGRLAASVPFAGSPFNHFIGYNPLEMRAEPLANGRTGVGDQAGAGLDARAMAMGAAASVTAAGTNQTAGQVSNGAAGGRFDAAAASRPVELAATSNSQGTSQHGGQSAFGALSGQGTAPSATSQPSAPQAQPATPQQVIEQIKVHITRAAKAGLDRVTIQLRPEDLGRIEIKLEMFQDGKVKATIAADNPATLELLQKDARGMERALQDAGLRADANDLEFSLRGEDSERLAGDGDGDARRGQASTGERDAANDNADADQGEFYDRQLAARRRGGVDTYA